MDPSINIIRRRSKQDFPKPNTQETYDFGGEQANRNAYAGSVYAPPNYNRKLKSIYDYEYFKTQATEYFTPGGQRGQNLLTVAALVPYKRVEVAIAVARKLGRPLEIVGTGPRMRSLRGLAGPDVRFLGWLDRDELREAYRRAAALLVPNVEDFGMVSVEALACGTPAVGLAASGTADVVRGGVEGELAEESSVDSLVEATARVLEREWDSEQLRQRADLFSREGFRTRFRFLLDRQGFGEAPP